MPHRHTDASAPDHQVDTQAVVIDIDGGLAGQRLDRALAETVPDLSRTRAQAAIAAGRVLVDGHTAKPSLLLEAGMRIVLETAAEDGAALPHAQPELVPDLRIIFEDAHLLVVDKPAGVVVHPAPGHAAGTLVDALRAHIPNLDTGGDPSRPGIVHRLDKNTSGLLVVAKDASTHAALARQLKERRMVKRYLALVEGQMPSQEGAIEAPIGRDPRFRQRMAVVAGAQGGREARTRFRVLQYAHGRSLLDVQLDTGRTHQIRVHLAAVQHPVVGDPVYGRHEPPLPPRQFLHAAHLELAHPVTGEWMVFEAPLPEDLAHFLADWER
ncbi:MAG TPA: RluA family pseudouridine synthase [Ktedonobacterales bacterium]|nr:RluA family pseudouridine synthase [Ktedonobacterales bacterium]